MEIISTKSDNTNVMVVIVTSYLHVQGKACDLWEGEACVVWVKENSIIIQVNRILVLLSKFKLKTILTFFSYLNIYFYGC